MMVSSYSWFTPPKVQNDVTSGEYLLYTDALVWRYAPSNHAEPEEHLKVSVQHDDPLLYDTETNHRQERNLIEDAPETRNKMEELLVTAMETLEAPTTEFDRFGLESTIDY